MKFLVFSDLHLHTWKYGSTYIDGFNSRLKAQKNVLLDIASYCRTHKIQEVFFNGDLFHTHGKVDVEVLTTAYTGFNAIAQHANITILVGNHDMADKEGRINSVMWLEGLSGDINVVNTDSSFVFNDTKFHCLPYTESKETLVDFLKRVEEDSFVFLHQGVANTPMGSGFVINEILTPDMIPDRVRHAFTGHYHKHHKVSDKLTIVGSVMQHTWDDAGNKCGWLVVDSETGDYEHVESEAPKFYVIDPTYNDLLWEFASPGYIRIEGYKEEDKKKVYDRWKNKKGVLSVELGKEPQVDEHIYSFKTKGFSLPPIVKEYSQAHKVPEYGTEIGRQIQEDTYEAPQP